jgi:hypothetical protein
MNLSAVDAIAKAVLYEGYMLYPYRPSSVKNQQRWNFGVICPRSYSESQNGTETWTMQTECLVVEGNAATTLDVRVRFLQLVARSIGELIGVPAGSSSGEVPEFRLVPQLEVAGRVYQSWQEAVEREVVVPAHQLHALAESPESFAFAFTAGRQYESLTEIGGRVAGIIVREQSALQGVVEIQAEQIGNKVFKVRVVVRNLTPFAAEQAHRDEALLSSLASTHTVLGVENGKFSSLLAPAEDVRKAAASCQNAGTWPVLVGDAGAQDTLLSSPIILYDHPQIAPESAGDLFDGTEIDEILSLRIMTLTDDEKREMSQSDERARAMLERTETLPMEQLMKLHGVLRNVHHAQPQLIEEESE